MVDENLMSQDKDPAQRGKTVRKTRSLFRKVESEDFQDLYDVRKLVLGIRRHLLLVVLCMAIFAGLGVMLTYKFLNTYQAESIVVYQEEENLSRNIEGGFTLTNLSLPTVLDMIKLPRHFERVKTLLGLDLAPDDIANMVNVPIPRNDSNLIRIEVSGTNPNLVTDIANSLADIAVKTSQEFNQKQLRMALLSYQEQLSVIRRTLSNQIQELENFKIKHQYFEMDPDHASLLGQMDNARTAYATAKLDYERNLVEYENLKREIQTLPEYVPLGKERFDNPLQKRIFSLQSLLAEARAKYTQDNPKVKQIEKELEELILNYNKAEADQTTYQLSERNAMRDELQLELLHMQAKVLSAQKVLQETAANLSHFENQLQKIPVQQMALVKLLQEKQVTEEQLLNMTKAAETAELLVKMPKGVIDNYQKATEAKPWKDAWWVEVIPLFGAVFGLGCGLFLAILIETMDSRFRTKKQLEMSYNLPCVATIPELDRLKRGNAEKRTLFFIRELSQYVDNFINEKQIKSPIIALASSRKGEGKSLIATELAGYYARLGKKTILVEFDALPNPFMEPFPEKAKGIAQYLAGEALLDELIVAGKPERMSIGPDADAMKEMLRSRKMVELITTLKAHYDLIVIDSPGVIEKDYATNLCALADMRIVVVGSSQTKKAAVDETLTVLERANGRPHALVLNRIQPLYIDDERIKLKMKEDRRGRIKRLLGLRT